MWLAKDNENTKLDCDTLLDLLKLYQEEMKAHLERYGQHKYILSGIIIALIAAGGWSLTSARIAYIAFFIPPFIAFLRFYTIRTLDRYYLSFLEAIACTNKIKVLLGLHRAIWPHKVEPKIDPDEIKLFKCDETIGSERWLIAKACNANAPKLSKDWIISKMKEGHNKVVWCFLGSLVFSSFIIPIFAVVKLWKPLNNQDTLGCILRYFFSNIQERNCLLIHIFLFTIISTTIIYIIQSEMIDKGREKYFESK